MLSKALPIGTVIKGEKFSYEIVSVLQADGQGYTYRTNTPIMRNGKPEVLATVLREHMMMRCSSRGDDGVSVVTPEDIAPTVDSCLDSFIFASQERLKISKACPWIINVLETFSANNTYYYAVEYVDGESLEEYVENKGGKLNWEQTHTILSPIFEAVRTLHRFHTLHTSIHPDHVRLAKRGERKVPILFSLYSSLHFSDTGLQRWTFPLMKCTEGFAPPEQYMEIDHFAPQIDIYALAAMMVFVLSGKRLPDSRKLSEEQIRQILPPELPDNVVLALLNALDPDMSKRTATVTKFREELGSFLSPSSSDRNLSNDRSDNDSETDASPSLMDRIKALLGLRGGRE
ncbi:MAG: serine/threonine-protein kinase, partial [Duncaniella sp.]|nr:serine/threonine-protein kinase [Duncaniella sp.]